MFFQAACNPFNQLKKENSMKPLLAASGFVIALTACNSLSGTPNIPIGKETNEYKVTEAGGVWAELKTDSPAQSNYRYGFTILLKHAERVRSVKIERIENGRAETVIDDSANGTTQPVWQPQQPDGTRSRLHGKGIGNTSWVGQTAEHNLTPAQSPWLYQSGDMQQHYRITITDMQGKQTVLHQPTMIPVKVKQLFRNFIR